MSARNHKRKHLELLVVKSKLFVGSQDHGMQSVLEQTGVVLELTRIAVSGYLDILELWVDEVPDCISFFLSRFSMEVCFVLFGCCWCFLFLMFFVKRISFFLVVVFPKVY